MTITFSTICIFCLLFFVFSSVGGEQKVDCTDKSKQTTSMKLKSKLLCGYDKYLRPVKHDSNKTSVMVMIAPRIISFYEDNSLFHVKAWIRMDWTDPLLTWDKLQYENMERIILDTNMVWVPDLHLYNSIEDMSLDQLLAPIMVTYQGNVSSFLSPVLPGHCVPNWTNWPYDVHTCTFVLGSKRFLGSAVDFHYFAEENHHIFMNYFLEGKEWKVLGTSATRNETILSSQNETTPIYLVTLNYNFTIMRHASVYIAAFVIPGFVSIILSLGLLWLPSDKVERIAVLCTLVIFQTLYLQYVGWKIPSNGDTTPYLACFYRDSLLLTGLLVIETLVTRSMLTWTTKPAYLQSTFQLVARNRVLQFIFMNDIDPKNAAKLMEAGNDEGSVLVTSDENVQNWQTFVSIINKSVFIVLLPVYILLSVSLLPLSFSISIY